jgi:hypothetical protein
MLAPVVTLV